MNIVYGNKSLLDGWVLINNTLGLPGRTDCLVGGRRGRWPVRRRVTLIYLLHQSSCVTQTVPDRRGESLKTCRLKSAQTSDAQVVHRQSAQSLRVTMTTSVSLTRTRTTLRPQRSGTYSVAMVTTCLTPRSQWKCWISWRRRPPALILFSQTLDWVGADRNLHENITCMTSRAQQPNAPHCGRTAPNCHRPSQRSYA